MIAEVLPITDAVDAIETPEHDCLEQVVRAAELASVEAHRLAAEGLRNRARWLAARAQRELEEVREQAGETVGTFVHNSVAAQRMHIGPGFAAYHAREARSCLRAAERLAVYRAHLEARWGVEAGDAGSEGV